MRLQAIVLSVILSLEAAATSIEDDHAYGPDLKLVQRHVLDNGDVFESFEDHSKPDGRLPPPQVPLSPASNTSHPLIKRNHPLDTTPHPCGSLKDYTFRCGLPTHRTPLSTCNGLLSLLRAPWANFTTLSTPRRHAHHCLRRKVQNPVDSIYERPSLDPHIRDGEQCCVSWGAHIGQKGGAANASELVPYVQKIVDMCAVPVGYVPAVMEYGKQCKFSVSGGQNFAILGGYCVNLCVGASPRACSLKSPWGLRDYVKEYIGGLPGWYKDTEAASSEVEDMPWLYTNPRGERINLDMFPNLTPSADQTAEELEQEWERYKNDETREGPKGLPSHNNVTLDAHHVCKDAVLAQMGPKWKTWGCRMQYPLDAESRCFEPSNIPNITRVVTSRTQSHLNHATRVYTTFLSTLALPIGFPTPRSTYTVIQTYLKLNTTPIPIVATAASRTILVTATEGVTPTTPPRPEDGTVTLTVWATTYPTRSISIEYGSWTEMTGTTGTTEPRTTEPRTTEARTTTGPTTRTTTATTNSAV